MADEQNTQEAQRQMHLAELQRLTDKVIEIGREDVGAETFDALAVDVAEAVGRENMEAVMTDIVHCDAPQRVIQHLSENPELAKSIAGMSQARRAQALGRVEAQLMPTGSGGGIEPAWFDRARGNKRGLGDDLSDKQWETNFKRLHPDGFKPRYAR
jgi:hypothetical protein